MIYLGYNYNENKQSHYANGYEREDIVRDRDNIFLTSYFDSEIDCYRWFQIEYSTSLELEVKNYKFPKSCGYEYTILDDNLTSVWQEYHIYTHVSLMEFFDNDNLQYGGNLSVRKKDGTRPLMLLVQDNVNLDCR